MNRVLEDGGRTEAPRPRLATKRRELIAALIIGGIGLLNMAKTMVDVVNPWAEYLWFVTYRHGFIKRGLVGTLFQAAFGNLPPTRQHQHILLVHYVACIALMTAMLAAAGLRIGRVRDRSLQGVLVAVLTILVVAPLWPTLSTMTGFADTLLMLLAFGGLIAFLHDRMFLFLLFGAMGPLVHEGFLFLWVPLQLVIAFDALLLRRSRLGFVLGGFVPAVVLGIALWLHDPLAAVMEIGQARLIYGGARPTIAVRQLGQTLSSALEITARYFIGRSVLLSAAYFLAAPVLVVLGLSGVVGLEQHREHRRGGPAGQPRRGWFFALFALVVLSPVSILALGSDVSRFLTWSAFTSFLLYIWYVDRLSERPEIREVPTRTVCVSVGVAAAYLLLYVPAPLPWTSFATGNVVGADKDSILNVTPGGRLVHALVAEVNGG